MRRRSSTRPLPATIILICAFVGGCNKQPAEDGEQPRGSAAAASTPIQQNRAAPAEPIIAAANDPFQPIPRLDADRLPPSCEAVVGIVLTADDRIQPMQTGFVFDADDGSAYIAVGDSTAGESVPGNNKPTKVVYQAVVGSGKGVRLVPLEIARRYPRSRGVVLSGPKKDLPPPLTLRKEVDAPEIGQRWYVIGFETPEAIPAMETPGCFARIAESLEVVLAGKSVFGRSVWFSLNRPENLRVPSGLVVADDGAIVALAHGGRRGYDCYPTDCLERFKKSEFVKFVARPRSFAARIADGASAVVPMQPEGAKFELDIRLQCVEYPRPLTRPRVLICSEPMMISPPAPDQKAYTTTWLFADSVRTPLREIRNGKWGSQPADLQMADFRLVPATEYLSLHAETESQLLDRPKPPVDKSLATYNATYAFSNMPKNGKFYIQCIFDDEQGVTKLFGPEQVVDSY